MYGPAEMERRMDRFRQQCRDRGLAVTHQREVIFRAMSEMRDHPSPEAIYEVVRRSIPSISLGTVYKNIRTFLDSGLVKEVSLHHGSLRLEVNTTPHHHLVCVSCKAIVDLLEEDVEPVRLHRRRPSGFQIQRINVEAVGLCAACAGEAGPVRKPAR
jgi:Fur family peroxide stress response transcriptional regulator